MRQLCFSFLLCFVIAESYGQDVSALPNSIRATSTLEGLNDINGLGGGEILYGIPLPPSTVKGDFFLNSNWKMTTVLLYDQEKLLEGFPARYDINTNELELKAKNGIRVLKGDKIKSFIWVDSLSKKPTYFLNAKDYNKDNVPLVGFFQVISDGHMPLFKKTSITIKKASYKVQFDVGSRENKILKKNDYYIIQDNHEIVELPHSKKKLLLFFGDQAPAVKEHIHTNSLDLNKEHHLKAIFDYYNSLVRN